MNKNNTIDTNYLQNVIKLTSNWTIYQHKQIIGLGSLAKRCLALMDLLFSYKNLKKFLKYHASNTFHNYYVITYNTGKNYLENKFKTSSE